MSNLREAFSNYKQNRVFNKIEYVINNQVNKENKIAIIVAFREQNQETKFRTKQLERFLEHFQRFMKGTKYHIFVIEQSEHKGFNLGIIKNIGMKIAMDMGYQVLVTHDVDLLPEMNMLPYYTMIPDYPLHLGWRWKTKYTFWGFLGGIMSMTPKMAIESNGFPNTFFKHGGEDDALYNRIASVYGSINRPCNGEILELSHEPPAPNQINRDKKKNILDDLRNWKSNGMNKLDYELVEKKENANYTVYKVKI